MPSLSMLLLAIVQAFILMALAPLMTGVSRMIRARMHSRRGPGVLQDYRDIIKLLRRQDVAPASSGFVFRITPSVTLGTMLLLAMTVPVFTTWSPVAASADLIAVVYVFAMARFFFSLCGVDSGSSFAGIGASRELTMGILVEPTLILALTVVALVVGSTNLGSIAGALANGAYALNPVSLILAALAFAFTMFIEMGKLPFDMAEAEQELQEGPLTEYSGASLGVLKLGLGLKKVVLAQILLGVLLPFGTATTLGAGSAVLALVALPVKLLIVFGIAGLIENSMARGRFTLVSRVTWIGFGFAVLAFVFYLTGL